MISENLQSHCIFSGDLRSLLAFARSIFETAAVEILNSFHDFGRDLDGCEIDLVIEANNRLNPIGIQLKATPPLSGCASFSVIPPELRILNPVDISGSL